MKYQAKVTHLNTKLNIYSIDIIEETYDEKCFIHHYSILRRNSQKLEIGSVITVIKEYPEKDALFFKEVFEYEVGEVLKLSFLNDYEKNKSNFRILEDKLGRLIDTRRKNWQTGYNYTPPKKGIKLEYVVINSENYLKIEEKWSSENRYDNSHLVINEKLKLKVMNSSEKDYLKIYDNDGIVSYIKQNNIFGGAIDFKDGEKYTFKIPYFYDDGYPKYFYSGTSPFFIGLEDFDIPKRFFQEIIKKDYNKEKYKRLQDLLLKQLKERNSNWTINFQNLFLHHVYYLMSLEKFPAIIKSIGYYEKFHQILMKSDYFKSFSNDKHDISRIKFGTTLKKLNTIKNVSIGIQSKKIKEYILKLVINIINEKKLHSESIYQFCVLWSNYPQKLIFNKEFLQKKLGDVYSKTIESHFEETKIEAIYLIPSIIIEATYRIEGFFKSLLFTIASDYRKTLRQQLTLKTYSYVDNTKLMQHRYDLKFFILLENLEYQSLELNDQKPEALLQLSRVKKYTALTFNNRDVSIKYLDKALDVLQNTELKLRKYLKEEDDLKKWGRLNQREIGKILEIKASLTKNYEDKIIIYKNILKHYLRGASKFNFYRAQIICNYYEMMILANKKTELSKVAKAASLILSEIDVEYATKSILRNAIVDLFTTTSLIGKEDKNSIDLLVKRSLKNTEKDIFIQDRQRYAKLVLSYNLLSNEIALKKIIEESIFMFLENGAVEVEQGNYENKKPEHEILDTIKDIEGVKLEFKGTWSLEAKDYLYANKIRCSEERKFDVFKAIAGMLNRDGGKLIIGVLELSDFDIKQVNEGGYQIVEECFLFGIDEEINSRKGFNLDKYILEMTNEFEEVFKYGAAVDNISINPVKLNTCSLLEINIEPFYSKSGVWIRKKGSDANYYYKRSTNSTLPLDINRAIEYNQKRFEEYNNKIRSV